MPRYDWVGGDTMQSVVTAVRLHVMQVVAVIRPWMAKTSLAG